MKRIRDLVGRPIDFTFTDKVFRTNTLAGYAHGFARALGSVTVEPLHESNGHSLWLEHVQEINRPEEEWFWLMWYFQGVPMLQDTSAFRRSEVSAICERFKKAEQNLLMS